MIFSLCLFRGFYFSFGHIAMKCYLFIIGRTSSARNLVYLLFFFPSFIGFALDLSLLLALFFEHFVHGSVLLVCISLRRCGCVYCELYYCHFWNALIFEREPKKHVSTENILQLNILIYLSMCFRLSAKMLPSRAIIDRAQNFCAKTFFCFKKRARATLCKRNMNAFVLLGAQDKMLEMLCSHHQSAV